MSRASRFFLWVIVLGLGFIVGVRLYRGYEQRAEEEAATQSAMPTMTFHDVPVRSMGEAQADFTVYDLRKEPPAVQEIYLEDVALSVPQQREQARQTIASILRDYQDEPVMQSFYAELRAATGREDINLAALSGEGLPQLLTQYPQLQEVIAKYAKNPQFAQMLQEIFSNPQFARSVTVLQRGNMASGQTTAVPAR